MKNKNENTPDYTRMQLKAFLGLFGVAVFVTLAFICTAILRFYGLGGDYPLFIGIQLLFCILLLFVIFVFAKRYTKPFKDIDRQLDALLSDDSSEFTYQKNCLLRSKSSML